MLSVDFDVNVVPAVSTAHRGDRMKADAFRYDGKRALVVGGATGMGAATAELVQDLGAEVVVMDHAEVTLPGVKAIQVDLRDKGAIDAALDECGGPIHALFSCAGVAEGTPGIEKINFISHRYLIERAVELGFLGRGSAVGMISSTGGIGWRNNLEAVSEFVAIDDFDAAVAWIAERPEKANYVWAKQAVNVYVTSNAFRLLGLGIRINAIMPGPTDTPLARANADVWLGMGADYREAAHVDASRSDEQAGPLVFLCSDAASHVTGEIMIVDAGYTASGIARTFDTAGDAVAFLESIT
jgi:NAD(P)-dependent dehydrogenase (short-subunit alcohol dehydrogenase family)